MLPKLNLVFYVLAIAAAIGAGYVDQWPTAISFMAVALSLSAHLRIAGER